MGKKVFSMMDLTAAADTEVNLETVMVKQTAKRNTDTTMTLTGPCASASLLSIYLSIYLSVIHSSFSHTQI